MKRRLLAVPAMVAVLVTGCPRQEYLVELTLRGNVMERQVTFYVADGADTNGAPNYQVFPSNELAAITRAYPPGSVALLGERHVATGTFAGAMPADIGGAGSYTNFATSLGSAGFYLERFRGNDDLATVTARRLKAADRLADLVIGWSRAELSREPRYGELRTFLDVDFRRDLKNLSLYWGQQQISSVTRSNADEEFFARYAQYLIEHGYLKSGDLPDLFHAVTENDDRLLAQKIQRLVAAKLRVPATAPMPKSLAFLADANATQVSWEKYLASTDEYRERMWKWRRQNLSGTYLSWSSLKRQVGGIFHSRTKAAPTGPPKPQPGAIADELLAEIFLGFGSGGDSLTVTLALPAAPLHTNGKWDRGARKIRWEANLPDNSGSEPRPPVFCFASWSEPEVAFQQAHFGRVILGGEDLTSYCLWLCGLSAPRITEWNTMVAGLQPADISAAKIDAFQFSGATNAAAAAGSAPPLDPAEHGRRLLKEAWARESSEAGK